jgi:N-acetylneuraminate synthase
MKIREVFEYSPSYPILREPYVIAECGVNHEGRLELAHRLIDLAAKGGADAAKFQAYKADTLAVLDSPAYWDLESEPTTSQRELFAKYDAFRPQDYTRLRDHCDDAGIEFLCTAFDSTFITLMGHLCPAMKIASADITCKPLVRQVAAFGKPVLLSVGAATPGEIEDAVGWIDEWRCKLVLSHCVLNYPTADGNANLKRIVGLREKWPTRWMGYSDHTLPGGMEALEAAWLLGAVVVEKHFTFDKSLPGNDHYHAMDWADLARFRRWTRRVVELFQAQDLESQGPARLHARRSLVTAGILPAGHVIAGSDLTWKRPAHGITPKAIDMVVGMVTSGSLAEDVVLRWEDLE